MWRGSCNSKGKAASFQVHLEVRTIYFLTSIGAQHNEPPLQIDDFDSDYDELLEPYKAADERGEGDSRWGSLGLRSLPTLLNLIPFWLKNSFRSTDAADKDEISTSCEEAKAPSKATSWRSTITLQIYHQPHPNADDFNLDSKLDTSGHSVRVSLLYSAVFETYSVGDRTHSSGVVFTAPLWKKYDGDWTVLTTGECQSPPHKRKSLALVDLKSEATRISGSGFNTQVYTVFGTATEESVQLNPGRPAQSRRSTTPPIFFGCSDCGRSFLSTDSLHHHERTHIRPFPCELCHASFSWPKDLRRHLTRHSSAKLFSCPLCQLPFTRKDNLLRHLRKNHRFAQKGSGNDVSYAGYTTCATPGPSTPSYPTSSPSGPNRSSSGNKRRRLTPDRRSRSNDGNDKSGFPFSPTPSLSITGSKPKRTIVCIFHRFDPNTYGNGDERYRTCGIRGFSFMSEHRTHLKRVHGIVECGEMRGCSPSNDVDRGGLSEKWRMEYRTHCDATPGAAEAHCIFWDSARRSVSPSIPAPLLEPALDNSNALTMHHMRPQAPMMRSVSDQQSSSSMHYLPLQIRTTQQQTSQSLSLRFQELQMDNNNLRSNLQIMSTNYQNLSNNYQTLSNNYQTLSNNYQTLSNNYQTLSNDYQALRAEVAELRRDGRRHSSQGPQLFPTDSLQDPLYTIPPTSVYPNPPDFTNLGTNIPLVDTGNDFQLESSPAVNSANMILLNSPLNTILQRTSSYSPATETIAIIPSAFQNTLQQPPPLTEGSSRSDMEEPGNPPQRPQLIVTSPGRRNPGKAPVRMTYSPTEEEDVDVMNWGS